jgi:hypothetical protein
LLREFSFRGFERLTIGAIPFSRRRLVIRPPYGGAALWRRRNAVIGARQHRIREAIGAELRQPYGGSKVFAGGQPRDCL